MTYPAPLRAQRHSSLRSIVTSGVATAVATGLVVVMGAGVAYARFSGGQGTGTGTTATGSVKTINASAATLAGTLYPNKTADLTVTIANPYPNMALRITGVAAGTAVIGVSGGGSNCTAGTAAVSVDTSASGFVPTTVAASATTSVTITGAVKMGPNSDSDCQGATFTVPVALQVKVG